MQVSRKLSSAVLAACVALTPSLSLAQDYFGRNKVQYETFDWRKMTAPHFDIYFYPEEEVVARDASRMAERWYSRHSALLSHTFSRMPLVFYANHPDFQQTNVIQDMLSEGTGGVTEGLRTRVILPFTGVYADNDHVLGHELVHVFQYNIAEQPRNGGLGKMEQLPLWLIEGMAEYLSLGRNDPLTAMWLRDAALRNDLPTIKQLTRDPRYFPYRYGQALWAYVGGKWGDQAIAQVYTSALRQGFEAGIKRELGISTDSLSKEWIARIRADYLPAMQGRSRPDSVSGLVLGQGKKAGDMNLSPSLSPDGKYVAFFSRRGVFTVDLYLADATTGKVIRRLTSPAQDSHFDAVSFLYSAATWSPDSRKVAYIVFGRGDNEIIIEDVASGRIERRIHPDPVDAINTIDWSPDGSTIAIAGSQGGMSDLWLYDLGADSLRRLTTDRYAELHPSWSPDGRSIAIATDRGNETSFENLSYGSMRLAVVDASSGAVRPLGAIAGAKMINPQWTPDGRALLFVSDRGGFSDIYRMDVATGALSQVTHLATGVSGVTHLSPAISIARSTGQLFYSVFDRQGYSVYSLGASELGGTPMDAVVTTNLAFGPYPGLLPPIDAAGRGEISRSLSDPTTGLPSASTTYPVGPYRAKLSLLALGQPMIGVGTSQFGTQASGGVSALFSDLLGNRNLGVALNAQGSLRDIGGQVYYLNSARRLNWAVFGGRIPYLTGGYTTEPTTVSAGGTSYDGIVYSQYLQRIYFDQLGGSVQYPFSQTQRVELNLAGNRVSSNTEVIQQIVVGNQVVDQKQENLGSGPSTTYGQANAAYVGDDAFFGYTSPVSGYRFRIEAGPSFGQIQMQTALLDFRRYLFLRPVTFAVRAIHYGRYGRDADRLSPLFLGQGTLVRGYSAGSFDAAECSVTNNPQACPEFDRLVGSRIGVGNVELRIPVMGGRELALINNPYLPMELSPFLDWGVAWSGSESANLQFVRNSTQRIPVASGGVTARFNVLGYAIAEVYYAKPFQRVARSGVWGFNLAPGW